MSCWRESETRSATSKRETDTDRQTTDKQTDRKQRSQNKVLLHTFSVMCEQLMRMLFDRDDALLQAPVVRTHAVQALELLQDDVSLQEVLVDLLERDPSPDVRTVVLKTIATSDHTFAGW